MYFRALVPAVHIPWGGWWYSQSGDGDTSGGNGGYGGGYSGGSSWS